MAAQRKWAPLAALLSALLLSSAARADEPFPEENTRPKRLYLALLFGGGLLDAKALGEAANTDTLQNGSIGTFEGVLRLGYRTSIGLSPIIEGRGALIFGTVSGDLASGLSFLGGLQYTPWVDALRAPYINVRAGVRDDAGNVHKAVAFGLGIELGRGQPFTTVELSVEPISPWLVTARVGAVF